MQYKLMSLRRRDQNVKRNKKYLRLCNKKRLNFYHVGNSNMESLLL